MKGGKVRALLYEQYLFNTTNITLEVNNWIIFFFSASPRTLHETQIEFHQFSQNRVIFQKVMLILLTIGN
jgi:hypothetical protein